MDDKSYIREKKKRQLRQNMIQAVPGEEQTLSKKYKDLGERKIRIIMVRAIVVASILFGIFFVWKFNRDNHKYKTFKEVWSQEILDGSVSSYVAFGENVMKYTRDGANYFGASGNTLWNQPYEMKSPIAVVNGSYVAIADQRGSSIVVCNKEGYTGTITTNLPILKVAISSHGVVAAILDDKKTNPIAYFSNDGTPIDTGINASIEESGYPLDISLSPEGEQLMVSYYVYIEGGLTQSHVVFYNFSQKGKVMQNGITGIFKSEGSTIIPKVQFLTDESACAFSDGGLTFYNLKNELLPSQKDQKITKEIKSIIYNSKYVGVIVDNEEGGSKYQLQVFTSSGTLVFKENLDLDYNKVEFGKDVVMLWNSTDCMIFNMKGKLKYSGTFHSEIVQIIQKPKDGDFVITDTQTMKEIKLK